MAKAQLTTKLGTRVIIEGSSEEVAELLARFEDGAQSFAAPSSATRHAKPSRERKVPKSPINLVAGLVDTGFFATPQALNAIKGALREQGHFYPVTTLSPTLLRLVRKKQLRRIKENKKWLYVA